MRGGTSVELVETTAGRLAELEAWLLDEGFPARRRPLAALDEPAPPRTVRLVDITGDFPTRRLSPGPAGRGGAGGDAAPAVTAGIVKEGDEAGLTKAIALGCDDLLLYPFDDDVLRCQLDSLVHAARIAREVRRRATVLAAFAGPEKPPPRRPGVPFGPKTRVLLIGPAGQTKVRLAETLAGVAITYADSLYEADARLSAERYDFAVLVVSGMTGRRALTRWLPPHRSQRPTLLLVSSREELDGLRSGGAAMILGGHLDDWIDARAAMPAMGLRLRLWLRVAGLRRDLEDGPQHALAEPVLDPLTGLFNHAFVMNYVAVTDRMPEAVEAQAALLARVANLDEINRSQGYAAGNRAMTLVGRRLRAMLRREDLLGHLGAGRFFALLDEVATAELNDILRRLQAGLGEALDQAGLTPRPMVALEGLPRVHAGDPDYLRERFKRLRPGGSRLIA